MSRETKIVVDQLVKDLRYRPENFTCNEHTLKDSETGLTYWVANGRSSGGVYGPYKMKFGMIQSIRFHAALDKWKAANVLYKCGLAAIKGEE